MTPEPAWWEQLGGDPTALFASLAFGATSVAAWATARYARTTRQMQHDASNPRLTISVGNVGWSPMHANVISAIAERGLWIETSPGDPITTGIVDDRYACHTVARLTNDGAATAFVRWDVEGGGRPDWDPSGDTIFRVTPDVFTVPAGDSIDITLYPALTADEWRKAAEVVTIVWNVEVRGQYRPGTIDTTSICWRIAHPTVENANQRVWADDPQRSCEVTGWNRRYVKS